MYKNYCFQHQLWQLNNEALPMYKTTLKDIGLEMGIDLEKLGLDMEELKKLESLRPLHCKERAKLAKDCVKSLGLLLLELHKEKEKDNATI